jgi:hypothetical protein
MQQYVCSLFVECKFTGFEVRPARITVTTTNKPLSLFELVPLGWAGLASPESGIRLIEDCAACGLKIYSGFEDPSKLVKETNWDGSDFFMVWPLPRVIFISDRVARTIKDQRLTGAQLRKPSDLKMGLLNELSPGRLSYWMPESRAAALGGALGIK